MNGGWVPLDSVQSGAQAQVERPSSAFVSIGGVRHGQVARRAPRTWQLDMGHAGPEVVTALAVAAQGDGGDVWLWDDSIARANLLDPIWARGRDDYPVVDCGGLRLRSLTLGPGSPTSVVDVPASANLTAWADSRNQGRTLRVSATPNQKAALLKFSVPATPAGRVYQSAQLRLTQDAADSVSIDVAATNNAWVEPVEVAGSWTDWGSSWAKQPAGTVLGSGTTPAVDGGLFAVSLSSVAAYAGSSLSLRLDRTGGDTATIFESRESASAPPVLRLTYAVAAAGARTTTMPLMAGSYVLSAWTDAASGTVLGTRKIGTGSVVNWTAPAGSGLRRANHALTVAADSDVTVTVNDSAAYVLGGLGLSSFLEDVYLPPGKSPVRVQVDDPTAVLDSLYDDEQGKGPRTVTIREVGT